MDFILFYINYSVKFSIFGDIFDGVSQIALLCEKQPLIQLKKFKRQLRLII